MQRLTINAFSTITICVFSSHDSSVLRSASFHGTGGALSLANDWSDNELSYSYEDNQAPPPSSPQLVRRDNKFIINPSKCLANLVNSVAVISLVFFPRISQ